MRSGFDVVAEVAAARGADRGNAISCITGEGRLDGQTLEGKGPAGVAALARQQGKPVLAFAGSIATDPAVAALFDCDLPDHRRAGRPRRGDARGARNSSSAPPDTRRAPRLRLGTDFYEHKRIALLFAGQGAQAVGMGQDLAAKYPAAAELFQPRRCRSSATR